MRIESLDYDLPADRIATQATEPRDAARLMVVDRTSQRVVHRRVADLGSEDAGILRAGDLLLMNRTTVLPAQFEGTRRGTGGKVGGLYLGSQATDRWSVLLESRGRLVEGDIIELDFETHFELLASSGHGNWSVRVESTLETPELLDRIGSMPVPPYIRKQRRIQGQSEIDDDDRHRYNTVFGDQPGSVAAPTASLHFTAALLDRLRDRGIEIATLCLHVGLGTFAPIRTKTVEDHAIHREWIEIPEATIGAIRRARNEARRIIPIGTTTVRAIESLPEPLPERFQTLTGLYIHPDAVRQGTFRFRFTDALMTNFHLPRSSLLALVAALPDVGIEKLLAWYDLAVRDEYRFYSYGDAMLLV